MDHTFGWAGWTRTSECQSQSLVPYHLATAQYNSKDNQNKKMGWIVGFEPTASRATIWRASQLRHTHRIKKMACLRGLEPRTYCLEGSCSIQLSYRHIIMERVMGIEPTRSAWKAEILPLNYTRLSILNSKDLAIIAKENTFVNTFLNFFIILIYLCRKETFGTDLILS